MGDRAVKTELYYRLPCSSLLLGGSVEIRTDWDEEEKVRYPSADLKLYVEADRRRPIVRLPTLPDSHEVALELSADGRIKAVNAATRSLLGEALEASFAVASFAAGLIGAAIAPRLPSLPAVAQPAPASGRPRAPAKTPADKWKAADPDGDARRLAAAREALKKLHDSIVATAATMVDNERPAPVMRTLVGLRAAVASVEAEIVAINTRRLAWYNTRYVSVEEHRYQFAMDEAFRLVRGDLVAPDRIRLSELADGGPAAQAGLKALYVAVVEIRTARVGEATIDDAEDLAQLESDNDRGELPAGIYFRVPRPATIAVYEDAADRDDDDADRELRLRSVDQYWVVDRASRLGSVPLDSAGNIKASAIFSDAGLLSSVSLDQEGKMQILIEALKAAPERVSAGLGQAKTVAETWSAIRAARVDAELAALETRKKQLEFDVANRGLEAEAAQATTLQELRDRIERLKLEKELGGPAPATPEADEAAALAKREAQLRSQVAIARLERQLASYTDAAEVPNQ